MKLSTIGTLALACFMAAPSALAQDNSNEVSKSSLPGAAVSVWKRQCEGAAGTPEENCYIGQAVGAKGRVIFTAQFGYSGANRAETAVLTTPLNVLLAPGVAIKIDDDEQITVPFSICNQAGCRSIFSISKELMGKMTAGKMMRVGWKSASGEDVVIPVQLAGFTAAWRTLDPKN